MQYRKHFDKNKFIFIWRSQLGFAYLPNNSKNMTSKTFELIERTSNGVLYYEIVSERGGIKGLNGHVELKIEPKGNELSTDLILRAINEFDAYVENYKKTIKSFTDIFNPIVVKTKTV